MFDTAQRTPAIRSSHRADQHTIIPQHAHTAPYVRRSQRHSLYIFQQAKKATLTYEVAFLKVQKLNQSSWLL